MNINSMLRKEYVEQLEDRVAKGFIEKSPALDGLIDQMKCAGTGYGNSFGSARPIVEVRRDNNGKT